MRSIPKDKDWLERFFRDDIEKGLIKSPLDIADVWPEGYSANSAEKVWAAKFAARHPNLAVLDLSSFKCGHDAPTFGLIDKIITAAGTPYMALHDIDANKPGGSMKIRVKTYAYTLKRREEALQEKAAKRSELERNLDERRWQLMGERAQALRSELQAQDARRAEWEEMDAAYEEYLQQEKSDTDDIAPSDND
jgi:hypothetical protein